MDFYEEDKQSFIVFIPDLKKDLTYYQLFSLSCMQIKIHDIIENTAY